MLKNHFCLQCCETNNRVSYSSCHAVISLESAINRGKIHTMATSSFLQGQKMKCQMSKKKKRNKGHTVVEMRVIRWYRRQDVGLNLEILYREQTIAAIQPWTLTDTAGECSNQQPPRWRWSLLCAPGLSRATWTLMKITSNHWLRSPKIVKANLKCSFVLATATHKKKGWWCDSDNGNSKISQDIAMLIAWRQLRLTLKMARTHIYFYFQDNWTSTLEWCVHFPGQGHPHVCVQQTQILII